MVWVRWVCCQEGRKAQDSEEEDGGGFDESARTQSQEYKNRSELEVMENDGGWQEDTKNWVGMLRIEVKKTE